MSPTRTARWAGLALCILAALATSASASKMRTISGQITWQGTGQPVVGALVKVLDDDTIGSDFMGQTFTGGAGDYSISYDADKNWDFCCFSSTNADPKIEVYVGGVLYLETGELASNIDSNRVFNLVLPTRSISGNVYWAGTGEKIAGAVVKAWDNDLIGRDFLGQASTSSNGDYKINYPVRGWDTFGGNPDPEMEVWVDNQLFLTTSEYSDVDHDITVNIAVTRILVQGAAAWQETCSPASGVTVQVRDDDTIGSDLMGTGTTTANGSYSISVPYKDDGSSNWDFCCGSDTSPDIYSEFLLSGSSKGKTSKLNNYAVSAGASKAIKQGTTVLWRGDVPPTANAVQADMDPDLQDWIEVEEYASCTRRQMRVTVYVKFENSNGMSAAQFSKLKTLFKQGLADNWSRLGSRAIPMPFTNSATKWEVLTRVVESSGGKNVQLNWITDKDFKRSNNVGGVAFFSFDPKIYYNAGFFKDRLGAGWEARCDQDFADTSAHEFGHSFLRNAVPKGWPRSWFGPIPLSLGQSYSWTHKGTSTILQNVRDDAPVYPKTGDADVMFYFKGSQPSGFEARTFAAPFDVRGLVAQAKMKRTRLSTCTCPLK